MDIDKYQLHARSTAIYPNIDKNWQYTLWGLGGEVGELINKGKKVIRDDQGILSEQRKIEMRDELGDILWYVAMAACELGITLNDLAMQNLEKLAKRRHTGTISGSGDKRQDSL